MAVGEGGGNHTLKNNNELLHIQNCLSNFSIVMTNTTNKAAYDRKHLIGAQGFKGLESVTIMVEEHVSQHAFMVLKQ